MKTMKYFLLGMACLLMMSMTAMAGDPLPLAEEGSADAEELRQAHEEDLADAMEDPEEAERRTEWLHRKEGQPADAIKPPEGEGY